MKYLLDTHVLIWVLENNEKLSATSKKIITDERHEIYVSDISFYEIAIKMSLKKLILPTSLKEAMQQTLKDGFIVLPLQREHIIKYSSLPFYEDHRDPFDKIIIATALAENMNIITIDQKFTLYSSIVNIIW